MSDTPQQQDEDGAGARDPDVVLLILRRVVARCPGIDPEAILLIEQEVRLEIGGRRHFIPKRKKHPTAQQRADMVRDALSAAETSDLERRHGVDRSTIYRNLKRFARGG